MVGMALGLYAKQRLGHGAAAGASRLSVETFQNGIFPQR
jgi:hypothetical protein